MWRIIDCLAAIIAQNSFSIHFTYLYVSEFFQRQTTTNNNKKREISSSKKARKFHVSLKFRSQTYIIFKFFFFCIFHFHHVIKRMREFFFLFWIRFFYLLLYLPFSNNIKKKLSSRNFAVDIHFILVLLYLCYVRSNLARRLKNM